eukprot:scaffold120845_cov56-Cyclotella_meneghiniana.AAC.1
MEAQPWEELHQQNLVPSLLFQQEHMLDSSAKTPPSAAPNFNIIRIIFIALAQSVWTFTRQQ